MIYEQQPSSRLIDKLWLVKTITLIARNAITDSQAGKRSNSEELYYLFELDKPLSLKDPISKVPLRNFKDAMKLTTLAHLQQTDKFNTLKQVYEDALI